MKTRGFAVKADLFDAPADVQEAEHHSTPAARQLVKAYNAAWYSCGRPYQEAISGPATP